ncbi:AbrB/MazE/SpoVT family DNA-binding domain-containing protein [Shewanella sp. 125m-7]
MTQIRICQMGKDLGLILPAEVVDQLNIVAGDSISLEKLPHGCYRLVKAEEQLAEQISLIESYMHEEDA